MNDKEICKKLNRDLIRKCFMTLLKRQRLQYWDKMKSFYSNTVTDAF